jgi:hypothetical protein
MELNVNDEIVAKPNTADIARAFDAKSFPADWSITLDNGDASLDALAEDDGRFTLAFSDGATFRRQLNVDAATLKSVFMKYLNGDTGWDAACHWDRPAKSGSKSGNESAAGHTSAASNKSGAGGMRFVPDTRPLAGRNRNGEPPAWAVVVVVATVGLITLLGAIHQWDGGATLRSLIPFSDSNYFWVGLIALPVLAIIVLSVGVKVFEWRAAKSWTQTTGRIVRSDIETRRHRFQGEAEKIVNAPAVEYEFKAGGRTVRGSRIAIGDDSGGVNTEATLARYPVGREVAVFYDPADPTNCVLERDGPQFTTAADKAKSDAGSPSAPASAAKSAGKDKVQATAKDASKGCVGGLIGLAVAGVAIYWMIVDGPAYLAAHFPNAPGDPRFVLAAAGFGLLALLFFFAFRSASKKAQSWPSVRGKIVKSAVETFLETEDGRTQTSHRAAVEFAYAVHGREYHGNQVKLMVQTGGSKVFAEKVCAKYPKGSDVEVHYDPANPGNAALENPTGMTWLVLAVAVAAFALAAWQLGIFG